MNQSKRQLNEDVLSDTQTKKLRNSRPNKNERTINCIENLSNEIFYEIFDYLHHWNIVNIFLNLNLRFDHLVNHSSLPIKIYSSTSFSYIYDTDYQQSIVSHKRRIISFYIDNDPHMTCFTLLSTDYASFDRLEYLVVEKIPHRTLISLLSDLINLPRLLSLKIDLHSETMDLIQVYRLIFSLPMLKFNQLSQPGSIFTRPLPYNINQFSSVEHLVIDYTCDAHSLYSILFYTPCLSRLTCEDLDFGETIIMERPLQTFNLKYVSINACLLIFDQLEILIKNLFSQLQVLRFGRVRDALYLNADRWERLILQYMPHLRILNIKYTDGIFRQPTLEPYHSKLNRFSSSFWIKRKWFFELKVDRRLSSMIPKIYSIQPLKKQWYEFQGYVNSHQISTCSTLPKQKCIDTSFSRLHFTIKHSQHSDHYRPFGEYVPSILDLVQFTSLHIDMHRFSISILLQFLHVLPNLDSLTITSKFPEETKILAEEQNNMFCFVSTHNKITKLSLEIMTELDQVHILMDLCPHMCELQVKCRNTIDAEWLIRYVLTKRNTNFIPHLCLICIWFAKADDRMTNNLQRIIDTEKLIENYTIKRICERIYIWWN